jgi:chitinase
MPGQPDYGGGGGGTTTYAAAATTTAEDDQQQQQQQQPGNMDRDPTSATSSEGGGTGVRPELLQPQQGGQAGGGQQQGGTATSTSSASSSSSPHMTEKRIIGYYAGWQWYDRDKLADPKNMDFRKVQRVNYAFFQPDAYGNIYGTDRWGDPQLLFGPYATLIEGGVQRCSYDGPEEVNCAYHAKQAGLIHRAHEAGAEVYPSIGGWTLSDNFPGMSADPVARDNFARRCVEILAYHDFDGIDIDWEYPGYADHSGTPADAENFTLLLAAIKAALEGHTRETGKVYGLSAALPCAPDNIANIEVDKLVHVLSEFNLMSYDFHGAWDAATGTNAPLYYQGFGNEEFNVDRCVENYVALGVPRGKINIGLPFYGRSFKFAYELNHIHGGSDVANWPDDDGTPQYFNIRAKLAHMVQVRDNKSKTQYAYISHSKQQGQSWGGGRRFLDMTEETPSSSSSSSTLAGTTTTTDGIAMTLPEGLVSFDDERAICDKVDYAQEKEIGGFIVWELSGDMLADLSTPLLDVVNMKLAHSSFECCTLHSEEECERERLEAEQAADFNSGEFDYGEWNPSSAGLDESGGSEGVRNRGASIARSGLVALIAATFFFIW